MFARQTPNLLQLINFCQCQLLLVFHQHFKGTSMFVTSKLPANDGCRSRQALRASPAGLANQEKFRVEGISAACDTCTFNETSDKAQYGSIYKLDINDQTYVMWTSIQLTVTCVSRCV
jgi:hypothetical protein